MSGTLKHAVEDALIRWHPAWIAYWAIATVALVGAVFFLNFYQWATAVLIFFGIPETLGVIKNDDHRPPLTHVIVRYVPPDATFIFIFGLVATAGAYWFGFNYPWRPGALFGLLGWFDWHFTSYYFDKRYERR